MDRAEASLQNLFIYLTSRNKQNRKNILINQSTFSYAINPKIYAEKEFQDYQIELIIFSNVKRGRSKFYIGQKSKVQFTDTVQKVATKMKQNGNCYVYVSSILSQDNYGLDQPQFVDNVKNLLIYFPGRVILELHPCEKINFKFRYMSLFFYFKNLYDSNVEQIPPCRLDSYSILDSRTGEQIFQQNTFKICQYQTCEDLNVKKLLTQNKPELAKDKLLICSNNVLQSLQKYKQYFQRNDFKNQKQKKLIAENIRNRLCPEREHVSSIQKIIQIFQAYGVVCIQTNNVQILRDVEEKKVLQKSDIPDYRDKFYTKELTMLQRGLQGFILENIEFFPIVITDHPQYFLESRIQTFKYVIIEDNFYQDSQNKDNINIDIQLKKILYRKNHEDNMKLYAFVQKVKLLAFIQKLKKISGKIMIQQCDKMTEKRLNRPNIYPYSLDNHYYMLQSQQNFQYQSERYFQQKERLKIFNFNQWIYIIKYKIDLTTKKESKRIQLPKIPIQFWKFLSFIKNQHYGNKFKKNSQIYKFLNEFGLQKLNQSIQIFIKENQKKITSQTFLQDQYSQKQPKAQVKEDKKWTLKKKILLQQTQIRKGINKKNQLQEQEEQAEQKQKQNKNKFISILSSDSQISGQQESDSKIKHKKVFLLLKEY